MRAVTEREPAPSTERSRAALDWVHRHLVARPSAASLEDVFAELADAFAATRAGLAGTLDGVPVVRAPRTAAPLPPCPWLVHPELLARVDDCTGALPLRTDAGESWLVASVGRHGESAWLVWLEADAARSWTAAEGVALLLAAQVLGRQAAAEPLPRWAHQLDLAWRQQRLEFAATVSGRLAHDYGNLLTSVLGFSELAQTQPPGSAGQKEHLKEVQRSVQRGAEFTNRLRLFARRGAAEGEQTAVAAAVAAAVERHRVRSNPAVRLVLNLAPDLPPAAVEADLFRHALTELLNNAFDALPAGGAVTVSARATELTAADCLDLLGGCRPGPSVEVAVADTGPGLCAEARRRLFVEPFFSTKPRHRGLGLATVYGVVRSHHGGLRLDGGPGGGTVVRLFLPQVLRPAPDLPPGLPPLLGHAPPRSAAPPPHSEKILVVDDDPLVLELVCATLEQAGYHTEGAGDAAEALERFAAAPLPFRLVLTDLVMPRMTGADLARRLRHDYPPEQVNVLFMSAHVSPDFALDDFADCGFDLLPKPFRPDELVQAVRAALDRGPVLG